MVDRKRKISLSIDGSNPTRKPLSLLQIVLLNAIVCGVEICACAGFTYIPPMLLKAGYTEENMSIILGMGPLLGFFLVPLIGRASDRCKSYFGRRRPFIMGLSSLLLVSLLLVPYGDFLSISILGPTSMSKNLEKVFLTFGVILLDFTSQACLTPCEALLSDASKETNQYERVFTIYSLMVSMGGFLGYLITAVDWSTSSIGRYFGNQEKSVFSMLILLFLVMLVATLIVADEQPLHVIQSTGSSAVNLMNEDMTFSRPLVNGALESGYETSSNSGDDEESNFLKLSLKKDINQPMVTRTWTKYSKLLNCFSSKFKLFSCIHNISKFIWVIIFDRLPNPFKKFFYIPYALRQLAVVNFCSWTAVMGFNLFFTDFVGQSIYKGNPNAPENSVDRHMFDEGVRMGSWGLLLHCITSAVYAFFLERIVDRCGPKLTYTFGMLMFCASMFFMVIVKNIVLVNIMAAFTGFGYATLTTIPFILVSKYHSNKEIFFFDVTPARTSSDLNQQSSRGIATDMATLDSAYFLSQVILSAIMGYIVHVTGTVLSYMVTAGLMGVLACILAQRLVTNKQDIRLHIQQQQQQRMKSDFII
ncbi:hypothetical protein ScPMuIL_015893 [Solemya velum]